MTTEPRPSVLTPDEASALNHLGHAFLLMKAISADRPSDFTEFVQAIHKAQNIIMARPTLRALAAEKRAAE